MAKPTAPNFAAHHRSPPQGEYVHLDRDYVLPRQFFVTHQLDTGGEATLEVATDDHGATRCVRLELHAPEDGSIVTEVLRAVPVGRLVHLGTTSQLLRCTELTGGGVKIEPADAEEQRQFYQRYSRARRARQGTPLTDDTLAQVATVYRAAASRTNRPTETVAETMNVARSTAARWVANARERGLLGPAIRGRAGEA